MIRPHLRLISIVGGVVAILTATIASAQVPPPQTPAQQQGRGGRAQPAGPSVTPNMTIAEAERSFDEWVLVQAKAPLQLDDQTRFTFMARFRVVQTVERQHQAARRRLIGELGALMKPDVPTDDAALAAKTKALDDLEAQHLQDFGKAMAAVDQILTVKQRARLRVFMNRVENDKLAYLAEARQQANIKAPAAPVQPGKIIK